MDPAPIQFEPIAEDALLLRFGERMDAALNERVRAAVLTLRHQLPRFEYIPAYASVLMRFDPLACHGATISSHEALQREVLAALGKGEALIHALREQEIPVCYRGAYGPDLPQVAQYLDLPIDEVITRHVSAEYQVAMIGFAPGFPYLLGLDPALAMPRRRDPRQRVPAGSVGIGGVQSGIYPDQLPGGWQLIGRTPLRLFDATATPPSLLAAGDLVRFRAIDENEFRHLEAEQLR
ncbi:MAG: 5-oxoprolinase subunit PxpB [Rhodanobacter sp.]